MNYQNIQTTLARSAKNSEYSVNYVKIAKLSEYSDNSAFLLKLSENSEYSDTLCIFIYLSDFLYIHKYYNTYF